MSVSSTLKAWTIVLAAADQDREFLVSYEVVATDEEAAARFALADLAKRGERAIDVEHAEAIAIANPFTPQGVRFRAGRSYFETRAA